MSLTVDKYTLLIYITFRRIQPQIIHPFNFSHHLHNAASWWVYAVVLYLSLYFALFFAWFFVFFAAFYSSAIMVNAFVCILWLLVVIILTHSRFYLFQWYWPLCRFHHIHITYSIFMQKCLFVLCLVLFCVKCPFCTLFWLSIWEINQLIINSLCIFSYRKMLIDRFSFIRCICLVF